MSLGLFHNVCISESLCQSNSSFSSLMSYLKCILAKIVRSSIHARLCPGVSQIGVRETNVMSIEHSPASKTAARSHGEHLHGVEVISAVVANPPFGLERERIRNVRRRETSSHRIHRDDCLVRVLVSCSPRNGVYYVLRRVTIRHPRYLRPRERRVVDQEAKECTFSSLPCILPPCTSAVR